MEMMVLLVPHLKYDDATNGTTLFRGTCPSNTLSYIYLFPHTDIASKFGNIPSSYRPLSEHSVPMVLHHIGGRVLTIEVSTHADVGDMNMHCTAIFGKARQGAVYASY